MYNFTIYYVVRINSIIASESNFFLQPVHQQISNEIHFEYFYQSHTHTLVTSTYREIMSIRIAAYAQTSFLCRFNELQYAISAAWRNDISHNIIKLLPFFYLLQQQKKDSWKLHERLDFIQFALAFDLLSKKINQIKQQKKVNVFYVILSKMRRWFCSLL